MNDSKASVKKLQIHGNSSLVINDWSCFEYNPVKKVHNCKSQGQSYLHVHVISGLDKIPSVATQNLCLSLNDYILAFSKNNSSDV